MQMYVSLWNLYECAYKYANVGVNILSYSREYDFLGADVNNIYSYGRTTTRDLASAFLNNWYMYDHDLTMSSYFCATLNWAGSIISSINVSMPQLGWILKIVYRMVVNQLRLFLKISKCQI